jgi:hypothetical protein
MIGLCYRCRAGTIFSSILPASPEERRQNLSKTNGKRALLSQKIAKSGLGGVAFLDVEILWKKMCYRNLPLQFSYGIEIHAETLLEKLLRFQ